MSHKVLRLTAGPKRQFLIDLLSRMEARFAGNSELRTEFHAGLAIAREIKVVADE